MSTVAPKTAALQHKRKARRAGKLQFGGAVFGDWTGRQPGDYSRNLQRLREIERVIHFRHGTIVPETDDPSYIEAAAYALNAHCFAKGGDLPASLRGWCSRWMPWSLPRAAELIRPVLNGLVHRKYDLRADDVARLLLVTFAEREHLGLSTIGAHDLPAKMRKAIVKDRKRKRDRARQAAIRTAEGRKDRSSYEAESLSRTQPWLAEGISRRTWERRRDKAVRDAGRQAVAGMSRADKYTKGDALASKVVIPGSSGSALFVVAGTLAKAPLAQSGKGAGSTDVCAEPLDAEHMHRHMGKAS